MLGSLTEEVKDVTKDLDMLMAKLNNHSKSVDSIEVKIVNCSESDLKRKYLEVSREIEVLDEDVMHFFFRPLPLDYRGG